MMQTYLKEMMDAVEFEREAFLSRISADSTILPQTIHKFYYTPLQHLLPHSKKHDEKTAGGRVLNALQQIIPWEEMLSTTHLKDLYANPMIKDGDRDNVLKALRVCYNLRKEYAHEIAAQDDYQKKLDAILKYRQIHCLDTAALTCEALKKDGFKPYFIDLINPYDTRSSQYISYHSVTLYSENKNMSLDDMFHDLTHPDVRLVDYWINEEGNAQKMLHQLNRRFKIDKNYLLICSVNTQKFEQEGTLHKKFVLEPDCSQGYEQFPLLTARAYELLFGTPDSFNLQRGGKFQTIRNINTRGSKRS